MTKVAQPSTALKEVIPALPSQDPHGVLPSAVLRSVLRLMAPVVRLLLHGGVQYTAFANALKQVFVDTAKDELMRSGLKVTGSAVSVLSGVHRKDIRQLQATDAAELRARAPSPASRAFTRWMTDRRYCERPGKPRSLQRTGAQGSFEALAREVSSDVHPRTLLKELARRGLVEVHDESVEPIAQSFVPSFDLDELMGLFADNAHDHIAAAVNNLTSERLMLEQSVFAQGLSDQSVRELGEISREVWAQAFQRIAAEATSRYERDRDSGATRRMRFGVYFYEEPQDGSDERKDKS